MDTYVIICFNPIFRASKINKEMVDNMCSAAVMEFPCSFKECVCLPQRYCFSSLCCFACRFT